MAHKCTGDEALQKIFTNLKSVLSGKSDTSHTHDRVNGYKIVVSDTAPTTDDKTVITIVK
jgi:hypothetical protein